MPTEKNALSGATTANGIRYRYQIKMVRTVPPGEESKLWSVRDICEQKITPEPDEAARAEVFQHALQLANKELRKKQKEPILQVTEAMAALLRVAVQVGNVDLIRTVRPDLPNADEHLEEGREALLKQAIAFCEALRSLDPDGPNLTVGLLAQSENTSRDILVCSLPKPELPQPPPGHLN